MVNKVEIIGYVAIEPEEGYSSGGSKRINLVIPTKTFFKNGRGEDVEHVDWHNITAYGPVAKAIKDKGIGKGSMVRVEGKIRYSKYGENKDKFFTSIICTHIIHLKKPFPVIDELKKDEDSYNRSEVVAGIPRWPNDEIENDLPF